MQDRCTDTPLAKLALRLANDVRNRQCGTATPPHGHCRETALRQIQFLRLTTPNHHQTVSPPAVRLSSPPPKRAQRRVKEEHTVSNATGHQRYYIGATRRPQISSRLSSTIRGPSCPVPYSAKYRIVGPHHGWLAHSRVSWPGGPYIVNSAAISYVTTWLIRSDHPYSGLGHLLPLLQPPQKRRIRCFGTLCPPSALPCHKLCSSSPHSSSWRT